MRRLIVSMILVLALPAAAVPPLLYLEGYAGLNLVLDDWDLNETPDVANEISHGGVLGLRLGGYPLEWLGIEGSLQVVTLSGDDVALDYGVGALFHPVELTWSPYLTLGAGFYGLVSDSALGSDVDYNVFWGAGVIGPLSRLLDLRIQLRHLITDGWEPDGYTAHNLELTITLRVSLLGNEPDQDGDGIGDIDDTCPKRAGPENTKGCPDSDRDGVSDDEDACERIPGDLSGLGCPDRDGDGLIDSEDRCPKRPGEIELYGCPDDDRDGVPNDLDKCPKQKEDRDDWEDVDGCPDPDNDGDRRPDISDKCPNEPEDIDNFEDEDGCPDLDDDKDGVPDRDDACPNKPETKNGYQDEDGCPDATVIIQGDRIVILQKVYFDSDSATIKSQSYAVLNAVADTVVKHPDITLLRIDGHTDDSGNAKRNRKLSRKRALAVATYLSKRGVASSRMKAAGFGESRPLMDGKSDEARSRNRRVEFKILERR
jgi:outer membrane protein OmpA-like peptidoglycan-associated protein